MKKSTLILLTTSCVIAIAPLARGQAQGQGQGRGQAQEHKLVYRDDGTFGYRDTPMQPCSAYRVHDPDRPKPKTIDPGDFSTQDHPGRPPSDAIVLFDDKDLSKWKPNQWKVENGDLIATTGRFETVDDFGSYQLHLEWRDPNPPVGDDIMNRGNNGVLLMSSFEIQIFDPTTKIYPDGQAAAVYGQTPPLVTASLPPGQWEVYDIIFLAPKFKGDKLEEPARVTVLYNGVLVQNNQEIYGPTTHASLPRPYRPGRSRAPLALGAHNNPVRFRNIWIRPL
jgi:hypothetical protein